LREASSDNTIYKASGLDLSSTTLFKGSFSQIPSNCTLVTHHEQHILFFGYFREALTNGVALSQAKYIIIKEHHANYLWTMYSLL
tara:strand:+ start:2530 stop:2784 length:255 start_codon:yes stop_codon:yes gene_type:complete